jgi:hypothetical protein
MDKEKIRKQSEEEAHKDLLEHLSNQEWLRKEVNKIEISIKDKVGFHIVVAGEYKGSFPIKILTFGINKNSKDESIESRMEGLKIFLSCITNDLEIIGKLKN